MNERKEFDFNIVSIVWDLANCSQTSRLLAVSDFTLRKFYECIEHERNECNGDIYEALKRVLGE